MNEKIIPITEDMDIDEEIKLTNKVSEELYENIFEQYEEKYRDKGYIIQTIAFDMFHNFACDLIEHCDWSREELCEHIVNKTHQSLEERFNEYMNGKDNDGDILLKSKG